MPSTRSQSWLLDRRHVLRGLGASLALPLLDCMVPAFARAQTSAPTLRRLGVVYLPNGIRMEHWTPLVEGRNFELTPILEPLRPWRDQLTIVSGLNNGPPHYAVHGAASTRFLTTMPPALVDPISSQFNFITHRHFSPALGLGSLQAPQAEREKGCRQ